MTGPGPCPHDVAAGERCPRCANAAEVGRPVGGGPRAVELIVARRNGDCPSCGGLIIAHQDRIGKLDDGWCCEDCVREAA